MLVCTDTIEGPGAPRKAKGAMVGFGYVLRLWSRTRRVDVGRFPALNECQRGRVCPPSLSVFCASGWRYQQDSGCMKSARSSPSAKENWCSKKCGWSQSSPLTTHTEFASWPPSASSSPCFAASWRALCFG